MELPDVEPDTDKHTYVTAFRTKLTKSPILHIFKALLYNCHKINMYFLVV